MIAGVEAVVEAVCHVQVVALYPWWVKADVKSRDRKSWVNPRSGQTGKASVIVATWSVVSERSSFLLASSTHAA